MELDTTVEWLHRLEVMAFPAGDPRHDFVDGERLIPGGAPLADVRARAKDGFLRESSPHGPVYAVPIALWDSFDPATLLGISMYASRADCAFTPGAPVLPPDLRQRYVDEIRAGQRGEWDNNGDDNGHRISLRPRTIGTGTTVRDVRAALDTSAKEVACPVCDATVYYWGGLDEDLGIFADALGDTAIVDMVMAHPAAQPQTKTPPPAHPIAVALLWRFDPITTTQE